VLFRSLDEDFPGIIQYRRKALLPTYHAIRIHNKKPDADKKYKVKLVLDKLYLDGTTYTHLTVETVPKPFDPESIAEKTIDDGYYFFGKHCALSNHHPCKFDVDGVSFNSSEQFLMLQKAIVAKDKRAQERIMKAKDAMEALNISKGISVNKEDWEKRAPKLFARGLYEKFEQNEHLKKKLISTAPMPIFEASFSDSYWGVKCGLHSQDLGNPVKMLGMNILGDLLVDLRTMMMGEADNEEHSDYAEEAEEEVEEAEEAES
jgi:hypothetical protein